MQIEASQDLINYINSKADSEYRLVSALIFHRDDMGDILVYQALTIDDLNINSASSLEMHDNLLLSKINNGVTITIKANVIDDESKSGSFSLYEKAIPDGDYTWFLWAKNDDSDIDINVSVSGNVNSL